MADGSSSCSAGHPEVGPPLAVYADPVNHFVAGFFGVPPMNFVDARSPRTRPVAFRAAGVTIVSTVRPEAVTRAMPVLGVRPEPCASATGRAGGRRRWGSPRALGDETIVFLDYGGPTSIVARSTPTRRSPSATTPLHVRPGQAPLLDGTTASASSAEAPRPSPEGSHGTLRRHAKHVCGTGLHR